MIAAASGCVLSWLPSSFALTAALASRIGDFTLGPAVVVRVCLVTGALVGLVWGVAQYAVLRLHAHRAGSWIVASTMTWTISFICLYFAAFWPDRTVSRLIHVGLTALAGLDSRICVRAVAGTCPRRASLAALGLDSSGVGSEPISTVKYVKAFHDDYCCWRTICPGRFDGI